MNGVIESAKEIPIGHLDLIGSWGKHPLFGRHKATAMPAGSCEYDENGFSSMEHVMFLVK